MGEVLQSAKGRRRLIGYAALLLALGLVLIWLLGSGRRQADPTLPDRTNIGVAPMPMDPPGPSPSPEGAIAPGFGFRGSSPVPTGGKAVAPLQIDWRMEREAGDKAGFSGTITVTNFGHRAQLEVSFQARGSLRIMSQAQVHFPSVERAEAIAIPISGVLGPSGDLGSIAVEAMVDIQGSRRPRVLIIDFDPRPAGDSGPQSGSQIITDDQGQRLILTPAGKN